jgi:hypothetical protein
MLMAISSLTSLEPSDISPVEGEYWKLFFYYHSTAADCKLSHHAMPPVVETDTNPTR